MAEAILLGSGTSNGVPMLGVVYPPEYLENPKNHRTRCALMVQGPTGNLLVDCPPEMRIQVTREGIHEIDAVLITHTHADHVMGMDDLRSICVLTGRAMPVYTLPRYQEDIRRIYNYAFEEMPPGIMVPRFDLRDVPESFEVGGLEIRTFQVWHGDTPVLGIRVNDFAYITDVNRIPPEAAPFLEGLDTLVLDAVRIKPHPTHFHFQESLEVARGIGARMTYLTHLSHDYDHDRTNETLPPNIQLAYDRLRISLD
jgi:phosphoribosyl 1,2-cyclic phosphate phosphodiesterase